MEHITLVERARQGNATAFSHLVTQHWRFVYTICLSHVGHAAEAEDLTQEVFVRVSHDLANLRAPDKFLPWLRQVTRNMSRMWHRRQRATSEPLDAIAEVDDPAAAARLRRSELSEIVHAMLAQVSPLSREVLALHYLAGYSEAELAVGRWPTHRRWSGELMGLAREATLLEHSHGMNGTLIPWPAGLSNHS